MSAGLRFHLCAAVDRDVAGKEGTPNASACSAAKAGVIALTKSLGKEIAGSGYSSMPSPLPRCEPICSTR